MINKKSIWFLTLFSLILVLSVYYITMPTELLNKDDNKDDVNVEESNLLTSLRIEADNELFTQMEELKKVLTDLNISVDEKNNAFEKMKSLNITRGEEENLQKIVKDKCDLNSFIKITGDQIRVVVKTDKHSTELANEIMRVIQEEYINQMYISVKFE